MSQQYQLKELIVASYEIKQSAKFVQNDLLILIESLNNTQVITPKLEQRTSLILNELKLAREIIAENTEIANNLYFTALNDLNVGDL